VRKLSNLKIGLIRSMCQYASAVATLSRILFGTILWNALEWSVYALPCYILVFSNSGYDIRLYYLPARRITLAQGRIRERSGQNSCSSPQLRTTNENADFVCPDSSQIARLQHACELLDRTPGDTAIGPFSTFVAPSRPSKSKEWEKFPSCRGTPCQNDN